MKICTFNLAQTPRKRFLTVLLSSGVVIANFNGASPTNTLTHVKKSSTTLKLLFREHTLSSVSASPLTTRFIGLNVDNLINMSTINQNHRYCTLLKPHPDIKSVQNPFMLAE